MRGFIGISNAVKEDHDEILKLFKKYKYTKDFGHMMFSNDDAYRRGWIRKAVFNGKIVGASCVRHCLRKPQTTLYFIAVDPEHKGNKIGLHLFEDVVLMSPHEVISFNLEKANTEAEGFYKKLGCVAIRESMKGKAFEYNYRKGTK